MSLKLLLDEDSQAKPLVKILQKAGHDVLTVNEAELMGEIDSVVLDYAIKENRVLLTRNCDDFEELHLLSSNHAGIIVIYQNDDYSKDMSRTDIVKALANLEAAGIPLSGQFIALNHWNY